MNNQKKLLTIMTLLCILSLLVMGIVLISSFYPQFAPPDFETSAQVGIPDPPENRDFSQLNADVFQVGLCGKIQMDKQTAECWLYNPPDNQVWLKLRILDGDGKNLAETGLLRPGEYLKNVTLTREMASGEMMKLKVMAYEPETYYSMGSVILNTPAIGRFEK